MEKEIKVRKKRFAAFWLAVLLVCTLVMPKMMQKAEALEISGPVENATVSVGDAITYENGGTVNYLGKDGVTTIHYAYFGYGDSHTVLGADAEELAGLNLTAQETVTGWRVKAENNASGYIDNIFLSPIIATLYTITFDSNGGSSVESISVVEGAVIPTIAAPTKTGCTFAGWEPALPETMPAGNLAVTAQWTENEYTITFHTDGGSTINPITQKYNTTVEAPAAPAKEGYTFAGWNPEVPETMPAENLEVTAQWTPNQYTITFDTAGGNAIDPITQDYGTAVTAPADPTRETDYFYGWDKAIPATMPAQNMTITAKWTPYVINAGTYDMKPDREHQLGSATKVSGDSSMYGSGITFRVPQDGSYTFE